MKNGNAPIGPDGKQINLHHILGEEPGPMAEIEATIHKDNHGVLHLMVKSRFRNNRSKKNAFETYRKKYWKLRAKDFE